jgi:hypothetical protein
VQVGGPAQCNKMLNVDANTACYGKPLDLTFSQSGDDDISVSRLDESVVLEMFLCGAFAIAFE